MAKILLINKDKMQKQIKNTGALRAPRWGEILRPSPSKSSFRFTSLKVGFPGVILPGVVARFSPWQPRGPYFSWNEGAQGASPLVWARSYTFMRYPRMNK